MRKSSSSSLLMLSQIHCTSLLDARKKEEQSINQQNKQSINQYVSNQSISWCGYHHLREDKGAAWAALAVIAATSATYIQAGKGRDVNCCMLN